ncbi:MAG TPA: thioredoxin family protein [Vicinamibacterales bacterium]|nr:thioredoxin family protein [Vicinamibacterales bacterium]
MALQIHLSAGVHVNSNQPRDPSLIPLLLTVDPPPGVSVIGVGYPRPSDLRQRGVDRPLSVFERDFHVGVRLWVAADHPIGAVVVPARLRYQACDEARCYVPAIAATEWTLSILPESAPINLVRPDLFRGLVFESPVDWRGPVPNETTTRQAAAASGLMTRLDRFVLASTAAGYQGTRDFTAFLQPSEGGARLAKPFEGRGILTILLLVLAGGLALNFTPCVLPLIPINLAILGAGTAAASRTRGLVLGTAYGGAMALVYGGLGVLVVLTSRAFGAVNSSPWFNGGIAILFVVLGLAMFDLFFIDFSRLSSRLKLTAEHGSLALAVSMGGVAALLAGACVAPVVIQVLVFSTDLYSSGTRAALGLPFVLGLGMAAPWPVVGAGLARLPRPGAWMVRVKQAIGVAILLLAAYYAHSAYRLFADRSVDRAAVVLGVGETPKEGWYSSLAEGLDAAERAHQPVLIDFWATWCKSCVAMDETTLRDPEVIAALAGYVKVKFQAEDPEAPVVRDVMDRFDVIGLPTYVVLRPKNQDKERQK